MQDETFDKFCQDKVEQLKLALQDAAKEAIQDISNEYLPYVVADVDGNVQWRTEDIVKKLLAGEYEVEGDYLLVEAPYCYVNIKVSEFQWDSFRKSLIKLMDKCPKDAEIASLKEQLRVAYDRRY